jgi:hypothetical protein
MRINMMKYNLLISLCFLVLIKSPAQTASPLEVVQAQLDAYNAQDIDSFTAVFAKDAEIFMNVGDTEPAIKGRAAIQERYGKMFTENPQNKSTLMGRMVQGNFVFDHEWITGRDSEFKIVAIYEVQNGLIVRAWFVR